MKNKLITRLKNVAGQLNGIIGMIEAEKDCIAIINQLKAARAGLKKVNILMAEDSLVQCFGKTLSPEKRAEAVRLIGELGK